MDIEKPLGPDGKPREPEIKFSTGLGSHLGKFDAVFKPRSEKAIWLLTEANKETV